jgi:cullin 1
LLSVDTQVQVLGTAAWPLTAPNDKPDIPVELIKTYDRFVGFYNKKHSGRKLTWLWNLCKNELRTTYANQKYTFQLSMYQTIVLLQFNHLGDSISYDDLKTATKLEEATLKGVLALLVRQRVIEQKENMYDLNLGFKSKKVRRSKCFLRCAHRGHTDPSQPQHAHQVGEQGGSG